MNQLSTLKSHYDVVIVGGGVNGCGIARECAYQGLSVACFDKGDFASGTSSASSKLIHGGLRYLENGHLRLVKEALSERFFLLKTAPHLVSPLPFVIPIYSNGEWSRIKTWIGVKLYDILCFGKGIKPSSYLSVNDVVAELPFINKEGLLGGVRYFDAQVDDSRLVIETAQHAENWGADMMNYVTVNSFSPSRMGGYSVELKDTVSGHTLSISAQCIINATGPWSDINGSKWGISDGARLRPSKGVHIITRKLKVDSAVLAHAPQDGRVFFVIPYHDFTLIGTTDTEFRGDISRLTVTESDISYLITAANSVFPIAELTEADVDAAFCGLRPLLNDKSDSVGSVSREEIIVEHNPGCWSLIGGKYTTFRSVSEKLARRVCNHLKLNRLYRSTRLLEFPGAGVVDIVSFSKYVLSQHTYSSRVSEEMVRALVKRYGSATPVVLEVCRENTWYFDLFPHSNVLIGELVYGIRYEYVRSPLDFFRRRTDIFFQNDHGKTALDCVLEVFSRELAWSDDERLYFTREYYQEYTKKGGF
jgi:glycerol-3-phosphate dehydrogenase